MIRSSFPRLEEARLRTFRPNTGNVGRALIVLVSYSSTEDSDSKTFQRRNERSTECERGWRDERRERE